MNGLNYQQQTQQTDRRQFVGDSITLEKKTMFT